MRIVFRSLLVAVVISLGASLPAGATTPYSASLTFSVPRSMNAHVRADGSYVVKPASAASLLALQRYISSNSQGVFGSSMSWVTIETVHASRSGRGHIFIPATTVGAWRTRLVAETNRHVVVARSPVATIDTYGTVPLATICSSLGSTSGGTGSCSGEGGLVTVQINDTIFSYDIQDSPAQIPPAYDELLQAPSSSCRSFSFDFMVDSEDQNQSPGETASLMVVQSGTEVASASAGAYGQGQLTASLNGGPWYLDAQGSAGLDGSAVADVYINGSGVCYTTTGVK